MAEITLDRLAVYIEANTKQFENQLKRLEGQINQSSTRMSSSFSKLNASIMSAGKSFAAAFGVGIGAGLLYQLPNMLIRSVNAMGDLQDAADKTGVSVEKLQKLIFAGLGSNTGMDQIVSAMGQFNRRVGEAATKGGELQKLFDANGLSLRDQSGVIRDNLELFKQVADLVKNARTEQEQTVIATMAFGKAGAEMLPILKQGGAEIERTMSAAVTHSGDLVKAVDALGDKWTERLKNMQTAMESFAASTALQMDSVIESMLGPLKTLDDYLKKNGGPGLGQSILNGLKTNPALIPFTGWGVAGQMFGGGSGTSAQPPAMDMVDIERQIREKSQLMAQLQSDLASQVASGADSVYVNGLKMRIEFLQREIDLLKARNQIIGSQTGRQPGGPVLQGWGSDGRLNGNAPFASPTVIPVAPEKIKETASAAKDLSAALSGVSRAVDQIDDGMAKLVERQRAVAEASQGIADDLQQFTHSLLDGTGKISDQLKSLLATLNRQMLDAFMFGNGPFAKFFGQAGANGAPGGMIGNLIGRFFGGGATGANPLATNAGAARVSVLDRAASAAASAAGGGVQSMFGGRIAGGDVGAGLSAPGVGGKIATMAPAVGGGSFSTVGNFIARGPGNVDPRLVDILKNAAVTSGKSVEAFSGYRPGDPRFHGKGLATDVNILGTDGKPIPNYQNASAFRSYEQYAQYARAYQMKAYPELADRFRWGGYFSGGPGKYGAMDLMHFDLAGGRGAGMAGGSWANGLSQAQRGLWPGAQSVGMNSLWKLFGFGYADGGLVHGPGGSRTDSVMARLSKGEFVVNASAAQKNLPTLNAMNSGRGSGTVVNIKNYSGMTIAQTTRRGPDGRDNLDLIIGQMEGRLMAGTRKMLGNEYGLTPQLARRS